MNSSILIVEDEFVVSLDLKNMLEDLGHQVVATVSRGEDVVPTALRQKPDLVLMDIRLAGVMTGTEAAVLLKQQLDVPIVFLTAYCDETVLQEAERSYPHGYLVKPFDRRELAATLRMAANKHKAELSCRRSEQRLKLAMAAARLSYFELDLGSGELELQGPLAEVSLAQPLTLHSMLARSEQDRLNKLLQAGKAFSGVFQARSGDALRFVQIHAQPQILTDRNSPVLLGVMEDVSRQQQHELQLRQAQAVFSTTAEAILVLDEQGTVVLANPAFSRISGFSLSNIRGLLPQQFLYPPASSGLAVPQLHELSATHWSGEVLCQRQDGSVFPAWQHLCKVRAPMTRGRRNHYVLMFSDISALRRAEEHLVTLVNLDHLTGLGNRRKLETVLKTEIERAHRAGTMLGILYLDLDGFKLVNDTLGHHVGDLLLQEVASRILLCTRAGDVAVRVGGDEFVLITPDIRGPMDCYAVAEKLLSSISADLQLGDTQVSISASIGIACYPNDALDYTGLLKCADLAMFAAKDAGRDRYMFFNPYLSEKAHLRVRLERDLKLALQAPVSQPQLAVHYQPIVDAVTLQICGVEALMRWQHPQLGAIAPDRFIKLAEQCNLIQELSDWLCAQVLKDVALLQELTPPQFYLALNLSVRQFDDGLLVERLQRFFTPQGLWPRLQFELTETAFMQSERLEACLQQLQRLGSSIALDDFGTGYSSLSRLKELPLDCLKIDRAFVAHMNNDSRSAQIVQAICALAHALDLILVAEGVETHEQLAALQQMGCQRIQGYLIAKPLPLDQLRLLLQHGVHLH